MRQLVVCLVLLGACTKPNPDACCTTAEQCSSFGLSDLRPCDAARVCTANGECIAPQCTIDSDCTDSAAPVCIDRQCAAKCGVDADCTDPAAPTCDADGACVACTADAQCTGSDAPICDATAHSCRGCTVDTECPSGVCIEALGECASDAQLVFVSPEGSANATCSKAAPCQTIDDGLRVVTAQRTVIRVVGAVVSASATATTQVELNSGVVIIDGNGTQIDGTLGIDGGTTAVIEGVGSRGASSGSDTVMIEINGGSLELRDAHVSNASVQISGGVTHIVSSSFERPRKGDGVSSTGGTVTVESSTFHDALVSAGSGELTVERCQFVMTQDGGFSADSAKIVARNNVVVSRSENGDSSFVFRALPGSLIAFNTFYNSSGVTGSAQPMHCDGSAPIDSNIIAWNTTQPPTCLTTHTLFDEHTSQLGDGNQSAPVATFFLAPETLDFHLSATSPARGAGDGTLGVTSDYDGATRPDPTGSSPDVGAFEAP